jgi:hypothetical protein
VHRRIGLAASWHEETTRQSQANEAQRSGGRQAKVAETRTSLSVGPDRTFAGSARRGPHHPLKEVRMERGEAQYPNPSVSKLLSNF